MAQWNSYTVNRRDILKTGVSLAGLGLLGGIPQVVTAAMAPPRPDLASPAGQQMLAIYKAAVAAMKSPSINNPPQPHSWTFQAYIHALPVNPKDPNSPGYPNGSAAFKKKIDQIYGPNPTGPAKAWKEAALACWSTCPHSSNHFLPWHRWYMFYFEQAIRTISSQPGFSLPYWNYASNENSSLQLPVAFTASTSPLYEAIRGLGWTDPVKLSSQTKPMNQGGYLGFKFVDYTPSLGATPLFPADASTTIFPPDPNWVKYGYSGRTETQPHDNVHDGVGGLMGNVPTAAADPIFYMHHSQIDRLWASWQSYGGSTNNFAPDGQGTQDQPSMADWQAMKFSFVDGTGTLVTVGPTQALDYQALGYSYDQLAPQPAHPAAAMLVAEAASNAQAAPLASEAGVKVGAAGLNLKLGSAAKEGGVTALEEGPAPGHLALTNVSLLKHPPAPLHVFVNLPAKGPTDLASPYYAGTINLFGLAMMGEDAEASETGHHMRHDKTIVFDIASILDQQRKQGLWKGGQITVSILMAGGKGAADDTYLNLGTVELRP